VATANAWNGAIDYGVLGGLLGLSLGLAGGLTRRSVGGAIVAACVGLVLGLAAGALPAFGVMPWYWGHHADDKATAGMLPLVFHCGLWAALGAAAGLAYGLGRAGQNPSRLVEGALGGLIGATLGSFAYEILGTLLFAQDRPDESFAATAAARVTAHVCIALFVALGAALMLDYPRRRAGKPVASGHPLGA
jgi:hypothetical protein